MLRDSNPVDRITFNEWQPEAGSLKPKLHETGRWGHWLSFENILAGQEPGLLSRPLRPGIATSGTAYPSIISLLKF